jgi:hypothetical protein
MFLHFNRAPLLLLSGKNKNPKIEHVRIKMCSNFFIFSHVQTYRCCFCSWFSDPLARALCEPANCNTVSRIQQEGKEKAGKHFHVFCCLSLSLSSIYLFLYRLRSRVKRFPLHPPPLYLSPSSCHFPSASLLALAYVSFPLQRSRNASLTTLLHSSPHPSPSCPPREAKAGSFTELLLGSSASSPPSLYS